MKSPSSVAGCGRRMKPGQFRRLSRTTPTAAAATQPGSTTPLSNPSSRSPVGDHRHPIRSIRIRPRAKANSSVSNSASRRRTARDRRLKNRTHGRLPARRTGKHERRSVDHPERQEHQGEGVSPAARGETPPVVGLQLVVLRAGHARVVARVVVAGDLLDALAAEHRLGGRAAHTVHAQLDPRGQRTDDGLPGAARGLLAQSCRPSSPAACPETRTSAWRPPEPGGRRRAPAWSRG